MAGMWEKCSGIGKEGGREGGGERRGEEREGEWEGGREGGRMGWIAHLSSSDSQSHEQSCLTNNSVCPNCT